MNKRYFESIKNIINEIETTQRKVIDQVSTICAEAIEKGNLLYFFGTGHSHMICEEVFYRAGGLACVYPILEPSLMLHEGAYKSSLIERLKGLGKILLEESEAKEGDILFLISNSGRNTTIVEMALEAKKKGIITIAITSLKHSTNTTSRHESGKKLYEITDYVIDNCVVKGDAAVEFENFPHKVGPTSSVAGIIIANAIVVNIVGKLIVSGFQPPIFKSANLDESDLHNRSFIERYKSRIKLL